MTFNSFHDDSHLYFITATLCGWKHLFTEPVYTNIVLNSLDWLRQANRASIYAYVIMPSHLHAIVKPKERSIGELLQNFGSFTAHKILNQLRQDQKDDLLKFFNEQVSDRHHKHRIWQDIQAKNIYSVKFLRQKLEYIHNNPIAKDWHLVDDRANYAYSSASFYDYGLSGLIGLDDVRQWFLGSIEDSSEPESD